MTFEHSSGLARAFDRATAKPQHTSLLFQESGNGAGESVFLQGADLNQLQSILRNRTQRIANTIMRDGDILDGCAITVNTLTGAVTLSDGQVYVKGDVRQIVGTTLVAVPMVGEIAIGVRLNSTVITHLGDADLLGLQVGSTSEGQPGAAREIETVVWGFEGDAGVGVLYDVYTIYDGTPVDQKAPPTLTGVNAQIGRYDYGAHGHYIVTGCDVSALGLVSGSQAFAISGGEFNVYGNKYVRDSDLRYTEVEVPDLEEVASEFRTFADGGSGTIVIAPYHVPISSVVSVRVEKQIVAESITRGVAGSSDALVNSSIKTLVTVNQGGTTYVSGTNFILTADRIDWSPAGAEPLSGSTYTATYRYIDSVALGGGGYTFTSTAITIVGGITGGDVILSYFFKRPRRDLLCLDKNGLPVYVKGLSARENPPKPIRPAELLALAEIYNTWIGTPQILNLGVKSVHFEKLIEHLLQAEETRYLLGIQMLQTKHAALDPVGKFGSFADNFDNDLLRDAGEPTQTAAIFDGKMVLAQDATVHDIALTGPLMLNYTSEIIIQQTKVSFCQKINPYAVVDPLPGELTLKPATDFFVDHDTVWLSGVTRMATSQQAIAATMRSTETVDTDTRVLQFLRQISITFTIRGFNAGEALSILTFDGVNVLPVVPPVANAQGTMTGTFIVPARVSSGTKRCNAQGALGSKASARFTGEGRLITTSRRNVTTVLRPQPIVSETGRDPAANSFVVTGSGRYITFIDLKFCVKGDATKSTFIEIVTSDNGYPTKNVIAQCVVDMSTVVLNAWHRCTFPAPIWVPSDIMHHFVIKTNDTTHSISAAAKGQIDIATGRTIAAHPYPSGNRFSGVNAETWIAHADVLAFRIGAALFSPTTKIYDFGQINVVDMSDVLVAAAVEIQTQNSSLVFELQRTNGTIYRVAPGQPLAFSEYITDTLTVRGIFTGSSTDSPVLIPELQIITGKIRAEATYISRAFSRGTAAKLGVLTQAKLPAGSALLVDYDQTDDNWLALTLFDTVAMDTGFNQLRHQRTPIVGTNIRVRLRLTGSPAARPALEGINAHALVS